MYFNAMTRLAGAFHAVVLVAGLAGLTGAGLAGFVAATTSPAAAADSGLPVPRFVTLRADTVNVRTGPGVRYPVDWVFVRRDLPVEVVAEFDTWRKIRDWQGTEGWVHQSMLSGKRGIVVIGGLQTMRAEPFDRSPAVARTEPGVLGYLLECERAWCKVKTVGLTGWLPREGLWGVYPDEAVE